MEFKNVPPDAMAAAVVMVAAAGAAAIGWAGRGLYRRLSGDNAPRQLSGASLAQPSNPGLPNGRKSKTCRSIPAHHFIVIVRNWLASLSPNQRSQARELVLDGAPTTSWGRKAKKWLDSLSPQQHDMVEEALSA
jgi:hypothetical protein